MIKTTGITVDSWQEIRKFFTKNSIKGSAGESVELIKASKLYLSIREYLNNDSLDSFNNDNELRAALILKNQLKEIGILDD